MQKYQSTLLVAMLTLFSCCANACMPSEDSYACPIDGEVFISAGGALPSAKIRHPGQFLDFEPNRRSCAPRSFLQCPSSGFVMFKEEFSSEELERLREFVKTTEYQSLRKVHTSFYLASRLQRVLGAPADLIAPTLLRATWQTKFPEQYRRYVIETLDAYHSISLSTYVDTKGWLQDQLIVGELERRLGRFAEAKARFEKLAAMTELVADLDRDIVELQLRLIEAKNSGKEKIPTKR